MLRECKTFRRLIIIYLYHWLVNTHIIIIRYKKTRRLAGFFSLTNIEFIQAYLKALS